MYTELRACAEEQNLRAMVDFTEQADISDVKFNISILGGKSSNKSFDS